MAAGCCALLHLLLLVTVGCSSLSQTATPAAPTLTVSEAAPLLSHTQMLSWKVNWPDAGLYSIKSKTVERGAAEVGGPGVHLNPSLAYFYAPPNI
jgi:hypothetical protein